MKKLKDKTRGGGKEVGVELKVLKDKNKFF